MREKNRRAAKGAPIPFNEKKEPVFGSYFFLAYRVVPRKIGVVL